MILMERWEEDVDSGNSAVSLSENKSEISKESFESVWVFH